MFLFCYKMFMQVKMFRFVQFGLRVCFLLHQIHRSKSSKISNMIIPGYDLQGEGSLMQDFTFQIKENSFDHIFCPSLLVDSSSNIFSLIDFLIITFLALEVAESKLQIAFSIKKIQKDTLLPFWCWNTAIWASDSWKVEGLT